MGRIIIGFHLPISVQKQQDTVAVLRVASRFSETWMHRDSVRNLGAKVMSVKCLGHSI